MSSGLVFHWPFCYLDPVMRSIFFFTVLTLAVASVPLAEEARPKISFRELEHHFGNVAQGDKPAYRFKFSNEGTAPLEIRNIQSSCGCTAAVAGQKTIEPQGAGEIDVTFNSAGRSGSFQKSVRVVTNDPASPTVELKILGLIVTPLTVEPRHVNLGLVRAGSDAQAEVRLALSAYDKELRITQIEKTAHLEAQAIDPVVDRDKGASIRVRILDTAPAGFLNGRISIRFDDPSIQPVTVGVSARIRGAVEVVPSRAHFFVRGDPDTPVHRQLKITGLETPDLRIERVDVDPELFKADVRAESAGKSYILDLELKTPVKERQLSRTVRIHTNEPSMKVIEIPVQVWVQDKPATQKP